jgi:hypothetical protein
MLSAGEIGAVFTIKNDASVVLRAIASQMNALQGTIDKAAASFKEFRLPPGVSTAIGRMDKAMSDAMLTAGKLEGSLADMGVAADKGAVGAVAGFGRIDAAISTTQGKLAALRKEMGSVGAPHAGGGSGGWPGAARGKGGSGGGHGGSAMHFGAHERFGPLAIRAVGDSSIPMAAGFGALFASYEAGKQAFDVAQADNNLRLMGASEDAIRKANAAALGMSAFGMSQTDALNALRVASVPLNTGGTTDTGLEAAAQVLPSLGKFDQVARSLKGEGGGDASKQMFELLKADELRNKLTAADANKFIGDYAKVYVGTGGKVDPNTFYAGLKYAKSAGMGFSDDFVNRYLPGIEMEEGGSTAGTMLMTTESALLGRRLKKPALGELKSMGIYGDDDKLKDAALAISNPFQWFQQDFMPALVKSGADTKGKQLEVMERLFSRNAAETGALLGINPGNVERTAASIGRANSLDQANASQNANDPFASLSQSIAAMKNFGAAFAGPMIPNVISGLSGFAGALDYATHSISATHLGADGKPEMLDSAKDSTWAWIKASFAAPAYAAAIPSNAAGRNFLGRDPRSPGPQSGLAYTPPSAPVSVSVTAPLTGQANVNIAAVNVKIGDQSIVAIVEREIKGAIAGIFHSLGASGTNGDSGHDGRASPSYPDHFHGAH